MGLSGYNIDFKVLNSKDFGVLQSRKRVIIIGWKKELDFKYPSFDFEEFQSTIRDLFYDLHKISAGEMKTPGNTNKTIRCKWRNTTLGLGYTITASSPSSKRFGFTNL